MKPRIIFLSQDAAERFTARVPYIVISMTTPGSSDARLPRSPFRRGVLRLSFHDLDKCPASLRDRVELFTPLRGDKVVKFVRLHPEARLIVAHCEAGISRSAGVAAALAKVFHGDDSDYFRRACPNRRVYREVLRAWRRRREPA